MAEGVVVSYPGMYEHVTKMGRVGKGHHKDPQSGRTTGPQFRKLPYQDQVIFQETKSSTPVPPTSPKSSQQVLTRPREEPLMDDFFEQPDISVPTERMKPKAAFTPYVEMKLGRNMRAAPKGSICSRASASDVSPQDLIETLNRNNLTSLTHETSVLEDERKKAAEHQERLEASLRKLQEEDKRKQEEEEMRERRMKIEQERLETLEDVQHKQDFVTRNDHFASVSPPPVVTPSADLAAPPPITNLYGSYRIKEDFYSEPKMSDQGSTQPFTPQNSTVFGQGGETTATTSSVRGTNSGKQETVDDVEDIEEDIHVENKNDDSDDGKSKEGDFDF